jgi:hypothetical protein
MGAKTVVVLSMAVVTTMAAERHAYSQDTRDPTLSTDVTVTVRLDNNARVPDQILLSATALTTDIYTWIGVKVVWLDVKDAIRQQIRPPYTVVLVSPEDENRTAPTEGIADDAIGQAIPVARRAYVFYERVTAKVALPHRDVVTLLGYAMAHELGHLWLPPNSHSTAGVMRPNFDIDSRGTHGFRPFTEAEARAIRKRLSNRDW